MVKINIDEEKLKELYNSGKSVKELSIIFQTSVDNIRNRLKALNIYKSTRYDYNNLGIGVEELKDYYSCHSKEETLKYFNITNNIFNYLLNSINYVKPHSARNELRKQTCLNKYGVENSSQIEGTQEKRKNTLINNFGSLENLYAQNYEKRKNTKIKIYGSLEAAENKRIENTIKYYKEKFGEDITCPFQVPEIKTKIDKTKLERYGTLTYNNVQKRKETNLRIHGDPNYNNFKKILETLTNHYGEDFQIIMGKKRQEGQLNRSLEEVER